LPDDAEHVNPNGGAIAIGHPLGASGARLITTAISQLHLAGARSALCTMCIGVGQGIAVVLERANPPEPESLHLCPISRAWGATQASEARVESGPAVRYRNNRAICE
jgi:hypothetical protein